jgi:hypothetical protein
MSAPALRLPRQLMKRAQQNLVREAMAAWATP